MSSPCGDGFQLGADAGVLGVREVGHVELQQRGVNLLTGLHTMDKESSVCLSATIVLYLYVHVHNLIVQYMYMNG